MFNNGVLWALGVVVLHPLLIYCMMCFAFPLCKAIVFCLLCVLRLCVSAAVLFTVYLTAVLLLALCLAALLWPFSIYIKYSMLCV
jgi:hypothetical protein